jgi:hypothetical protein
MNPLENTDVPSRARDLSPWPSAEDDMGIAELIDDRPNGERVGANADEPRDEKERAALPEPIRIGMKPPRLPPAGMMGPLGPMFPGVDIVMAPYPPRPELCAQAGKERNHKKPPAKTRHTSSLSDLARMTRFPRGKKPQRVRHHREIPDQHLREIVRLPAVAPLVVRNVP